VGARVVGETFHRAMEGSEHSIVRDTAFKPTLGNRQRLTWEVEDMGATVGELRLAERCSSK
jgi:hypothetical protein